ncbi:tannase and feruloyl esterase [Mariannaea sp. PMI_226]|nr:tannase and feruloyl esterase [Mariannaea sp. PMI_226]
MQLPLALGVSVLQATQGAICSWADHCANLAEILTTPNTTIRFAQEIRAGTTVTFPENHSSCGRTEQTVHVDICRVAMVVKTSPTSSVDLEAWLPFDWTGRFLSSGNGGLGGCILYEDLSHAVTNGFAAVGTNGGHDGLSGRAFYLNPGTIEDFAYRSVRISVAIGKDITEAFYGKRYKKSYFLGCSYGGSQGLKSAQDFPGDFDGIVVGAPAIAFNELTYWRGRFLTITGTPDDSGFISAELWSKIQEDVLEQCDYLDGSMDGIIEDPNLCQYRPEALICDKDEDEACLTGDQVKRVRAIFSPLYGTDGSLIYPRLQPGVSNGPLFSGKPFPYTTDWFRYAVHNDLNWDPQTISSKDYEVAAQFNPFNINTWNGNLSEARNHGTKILHYHGLQDAKISSEISMMYYDHVARTMRLRTDAMDEFYRYFRISGMNHCQGGPGATFIGNYEYNVHNNDPESNVLAAIVRWVEKGIAPESILGTAYMDGSKSSGKIAFQRRHCRYPLRNEYDGMGDPTGPDSWNCV